MPVILPAIGFVLTTHLLFHLRPTGRSRREAFLLAACILGAMTVVATEIFSLLRLIAPPAITAFWLIVCAAAAGVHFMTRRPAPGPQSPVAEKPTLTVRLLLAGLCFYVAVTGLIALIAPPNTWDSMEYHMPKVMHWIQNRTVEFYPTSIPRQNHLAPGAEFGILHLQLLSGSDRFANLVEWIAMVGSLVAVSLIARQLGTVVKGQLLAAMFAATIPMGILQASSTQTDYVIAFWLSCFVFFMLRLRGNAGVSWPLLVALSLSLGLAVFTKATAYVFAAPFLPWLLLILLRNRTFPVLLAAFLIAAVFVSVNIGHYSRNWSLHGNPLGPGEEPTRNTKYTLDSHSPVALVSSLAKNISTHINTPWPVVNGAIQRVYVALHEKIGWDINDPRTTWGSFGPRFSIRRIAYHDETDGNPVHFLFGAGVFLIVMILPSLRKDRLLLAYAAALAIGFLFFAFYLKWHPWMSRLHLPWFILLAPLAGAVIYRLRPNWILPSAAASLWLLGLPWLFYCQQRPMIASVNIFNTPREQQYFKTPTPWPSYQASFLAGRDFLANRNISRIGLVVGNASWEYPWWVLLRSVNPDVRIEHVNVSDPSAALSARPPFIDFQPEAVISLDQKPENAEELTVGACIYRRAWTQERVGIYLRE